MSTYIKHVKTHDGSNARKNAFIQGMCDDLREQATLQLDRMLGVTESLSDVERPEKRELVELGPSAQPSKKAKATNGTDIATTAAVEGLRGKFIISVASHPMLIPK